MLQSQLYMRKNTLDDLSALSTMMKTLPSDISLHTHRAGDNEEWEALIELCFGEHYGFEQNVSSCKGYDPSYVFYLERNGENIAVSAAVNNPDFPEEGWLHFVGVAPSARGNGLAAHIVLAALYCFYARGFKSVLLSTDDFRIPAIKTYLSLGFEPIMLDESHPERWHKVMNAIKGNS